MKLRWRKLTKSELHDNTFSLNGVAEIRRDAWSVEHCVLEFQEDSQTRKDHWTRVEMVYDPNPRGDNK